MKVTYLGVGEGFDERYPNTSILVETTSGNLLLDCGFSAVLEFWKRVKDPDLIDIVYLTHRHADHALGLGSLLVRFFEEGRKKPITICCHSNIRDFAAGIVDYCYPGVGRFIRYPIKVVGFEDEWSWKGVRLRIAQTSHFDTVPNHAVRVEADNQVLCYSGDGRITPESEALFKGADLLVHEGYSRTGEIIGHGTMEAVKALAAKLGIKNVDLIHLKRIVRPEKEKNAEFVRGWASIPEPGDTREL